MSSTEIGSAFTALDWGILVVYLAGTTALGVWLGRDQKEDVTWHDRTCEAVPRGNDGG